MTFFYALLWMIASVLCQVLVFNHLSLAGGVVLFYLYMLIKMPVEINRPLQILSGFALGMIIDIFCNTHGLHALACTTTMWLRLPVLHMFVLADDLKAGSPDSHKLSSPLFTRYSLSIVVIHTVLLYLIESFTLFNFWHLVLKMFFTVGLTFVMVMALELFSTKK